MRFIYFKKLIKKFFLSNLFKYNFLANPGDSVSGAYLFLPNGPAKELPSDENIFAIISGSVRQYIFIKSRHFFYNR